MALSMFAWTFLFENVANPRRAARLPLGLVSIFIAFATYLYADMITTYGPPTQSWAMTALLTVTIHMAAIAVAGIFWTITGPSLARRFLNAPMALLTVAFVWAVACFALSYRYANSYGG